MVLESRKYYSCAVVYFQLPGPWSLGDSFSLLILLSLFSVSSPQHIRTIENRLTSEYIQDFVGMKDCGVGWEHILKKKKREEKSQRKKESKERKERKKWQELVNHSS